MTTSLASYHLLKLFPGTHTPHTRAALAPQTEVATATPSPMQSFLAHVGQYMDFRDKMVLDVGCGTGDSAIALCKLGARAVVGVDLDEVRIITARRNAARAGVADRCRFVCADFVLQYEPVQPVDIVFSQSAFEHILTPRACLQKVYECLRPGGALGTVFGPLWLSPNGAQMWDFTLVPWVHLIFPEEMVLRLRQARYRRDEFPVHYADIRGQLNRMTLRQFRRYAAEAGFITETLLLNPIQGHYPRVSQSATGISPLQEWGAHQVVAVLRKPLASGHARYLS